MGAALGGLPVPTNKLCFLALAAADILCALLYSQRMVVVFIKCIYTRNLLLFSLHTESPFSLLQTTVIS